MVIPVADDPGAPQCINVADANASDLCTLKNVVELDDGGRETPVFVIAILQKLIGFSITYFRLITLTIK